MNKCEYCKIAPKTLAICENAEPRIFIDVSGSYLQVFDEEYPGFVENFEINFCPMCGRRLREVRE